MTKTNKHWYSFPEYGAFFQLVHGELMGAPMNADGTIETVDGAPNGGEVAVEALGEIDVDRVLAILWLHP